MVVRVNIVEGSTKIAEVPHHEYGSIYIVHCVDDEGNRWRCIHDFIKLGFADNKALVTEQQGSIRIDYDEQLGWDWIAYEV